MTVYSCVLEIDLPLYEALQSQNDETARFESRVEKTKTGVKVTIRAADATSLTTGANHWLRLIKAGSGVYKVI